jgi:nitroimidazol reductase NimA-like FMN-containing flavoprotein (pyridoxamine 5'-phosphate oxidase superfamily)
VDALTLTDSGGLEKLDRASCYALLRTVPIGRIVFTESALPAIQPVNFVLDGEDVIIRTSSGSKLAAATRSAVVAFEADDYADATMTGWSVVIVGRSEVITVGAEHRRLDALGLTPWALGRRPHYIRVRPEIVRGRRLRTRPPSL